MRSLFSYLITIFGIMYWCFRVVVSFMYSLGKEFICTPLNPNIEMGILFFTVLCIICIIRRNLFVTIVYFGVYASYFGTILYRGLIGVVNGEQVLSATDSTSLMIATLGVLIPFLILCDVALQKTGLHKKDKKVDWYYEDEKYDRNFDERADRNQYKIR